MYLQGRRGCVNWYCRYDRVPFFERCKFLGKFETKNDLQNFYVNHPSPRIFMTHLQYHELPQGGTDKPKYIYVMRNPKDAAVSFYHHYKGLEMYEFSDGTWDEFFEMFMDNKGKKCLFSLYIYYLSLHFSGKSRVVFEEGGGGGHTHTHAKRTSTQCTSPTPFISPRSTPGLLN